MINSIGRATRTMIQRLISIPVMLGMVGRLLNARMFVSALSMVLAARALAAPDFTLTLQPSSLTLIPDQESSLIISITPLDGFATNVTLSAEGLPAGVTATFQPATLTPPGTSVLTLNAATNATLGGFTLNVTGIGGGVSNTTSSSVTVNFGLLPVCTSAFTGQVTDAQTGLPVGNAVVTTGYLDGDTDSNGFYIILPSPWDRVHFARQRQSKSYIRCPWQK
jgi:hypothetical protein